MKPFDQMTYFELTRYISELSTELWALAKALENNFPELHETALYAQTLKNAVYMIDTIQEFLVS